MVPQQSYGKCLCHSNCQIYAAKSHLVWDQGLELVCAYPQGLSTRLESFELCFTFLKLPLCSLENWNDLLRVQNQGWTRFPLFEYDRRIGYLSDKELSIAVWIDWHRVIWFRWWANKETFKKECLAFSQCRNMSFKCCEVTKLHHSVKGATNLKIIPEWY